MKNLDLINEARRRLGEALQAAATEDNPELFAEAFTKFAAELQEHIVADAREAAAGASDAAVLAARGVRQLTSAEREYYAAVIGAMKSSNPRQALTDIDKTVPPTIINEVFEYLKEAHPLLDLIDFQSTGLLTQWILSESTGAAIWGELTAAITAELSGAFSTVDLNLYKLSAFIPVAKSMLDLGPEWLDRYVRTLLAEALSVGLEAAIVDGDGNKKPLGMTRKLSGDSGGVFPRKTAVPLAELTPAALAPILDTISKAPNDTRRAVPRLLLVVNPADYYTKVYPATTVRTPTGSFNHDVLPYPTDVVQSDAVPSGLAVLGLASRYFFGLGSSKGGRLEYSDEYKFLEDNRVYLIKLYGNGRARDENAFVLADISNLKPTTNEVVILSSEENPVWTKAVEEE
jgi:HK97 family phage major capsid protein